MRRTRERLEDILEFIQLIQQHLPHSRQTYDADIVMKYFLMKQVEIIGGAVFKLDKTFKETHPAVPWKKIEGTRHV